MQIFSPIIPGGHDELPILSLVGTIDHAREAINAGNVTDVEKGKKYMAWQLNNLFILQHPHASKVAEILNSNDSLSNNGLFETRQKLLKLADTIQDEIRGIVEKNSGVCTVAVSSRQEPISENEEGRKAA